MNRDDAVASVIALAAFLTGLLFIVDAGGAPRAVVATLFLLIGPGLAFARLLRLGDSWTELTVAVAASLGLEAVIATALLVTGLWSPGRMLAIVILFTFCCLFVSVRTPRGAAVRDGFRQAASAALTTTDRKGHTP